MKSRNSIIFLLAAVTLFVFPKIIQAETSDKVRLELKVLSSDHLILMPAELEFRLINLTDSTIKDVPNIDYKYSSNGIRIVLSYKRIEKNIIYPVRQTSSEGVIPAPQTFDLDSFQTAAFHLSLLFDWYKDKNMTLFTQPGSYTIYGTHTIPGIGIIESNKVKIEYRGPETKNEREAVSLLRPFGNGLVYIYSIPTQLAGSGNSMPKNIERIHNIVQSVRKVYEMAPPTKFKKYMRKALLQWKQDEIDTTEMDLYSWKKRKIDKLGLQDLDLDD